MYEFGLGRGVVLGRYLHILGAPSVQSCCTFCFLQCNCVWQIWQIQTCVCVVVRPGVVSTSPAFKRSSASHPADPHGPP